MSIENAHIRKSLITNYLTPNTFLMKPHTQHILQYLLRTGTLSEGGVVDDVDVIFFTDGSY